MKYTTVTLDEMNALLNTFGVWSEVLNGRFREHVLDYTLPNFPGVVVRVYSSVHHDTGVGRRKGADAIRVCAVHLAKNIGWIRSTRVLRVEGWRDNLHRAISRTIHQAVDRCEQLARAQAARRASEEAARQAAMNAPVEDIPFNVPA